MRFPFIGLLAFLAVGAAPASPALAQGQVYEPAPPQGSAYVRIVNTLPGEVQIQPDFLPAQRLGTEPAQRVMAYTVVENVAGRALRLDVIEGQRRGQGSLSVAPGAFVTVIIHRGAGGNPAITAVSEDTDFNRARARLAFYNALPDCPAAAVQLQPGGQAVFSDIPALQGRARSVNPVAAQVRTSCGARASAAFALDGLEPGGMYSIWMIPGPHAAAPQAFLLRDTTAAYRP
jgi:hypothetical protein